MTLKNRAINKIIECIDRSTNIDHLAACKRMMDLLYHYDVKKKTLTYLGLKYRSKFNVYRFIDILIELIIIQIILSLILQFIKC